MATATLSLNVLVFQSLKNGSVMGVGRTGLFQILILLGGLYVLFQNHTGLRSTRWLQSLPVTSRTLWTAHVRALVAAVSLVIFAMLVVVLGLSQLISRFDPHEFHQPLEIPTLFVRPWLIMLAVALVLGAWRSSLVDPGNAAGWNRWRLTVALAAIAVLVIVQLAPLPVALAPVLAAYVWARRQCAHLPATLTLAETPDGSITGDDRPVRTHGRVTVHWIIRRQLFKWPLSWIIGVPMTFLLGMVQGGAFSYSLDADFARYFNLWITAYMMIAFVGHFLEKLHHVDHLPISRAALMRWLILPNVVALLLGGMTGYFMEIARDPVETIAFENDASRPHNGLLVPVDLWEPVWGSETRTVTAPWGESHAAEPVSVIEGLPLGLWKPYTTVPEASPDFVAWQISRAISAAYGVTVIPDDIRDRYLVEGPDGAVNVRDEGLNPLADGLVEGRRTKGPIQGLLLGFIICLGLATFCFIFAMCGPGNSTRRVKTVFWSAMGVLMVFHLGGYGLLMTRLVKDWTVTALVEGLATRLAAMGPVGWLLPWVLGIGLAVLLWILCGRAFAKVEAVRGRSSSTSC
jgi:hypothetical protein